MQLQTNDPYDEFHYPNYSYPQSHPDRLGSLATLFGMSPAPVEHCRLLELACGDGANLLPLAQGLPGSEFVGIDRAAQPIVHGEQMINALGLKNIQLQQRDILELAPDVGKFDYIIAHGLYSWVPAQVQEHILEICRASLNPQGVVYISYNVYPGCHLREITRGMMLYHTRELQDARDRVAQSRALIRWLAEAQTQTNAYSLFLQQVNEAFAKKNDGAIFHDDLAEVNSPLYFYQFISKAAEHGLQFLSEAEYFYTPEHIFRPEVSRELQRMEEDDIIGKEQYVDFLEARSFRQTLLCHHEIKLDRHLKTETVHQFYIRADIRSVSAQVDLESEAIEEFRGPKDCAISTSFPLAKAAMTHLGSIYPHSIRFDDLVTRAYQRLSVTPQGDVGTSQYSEEANALGDVILKAYGAGVVELHLHEPSFTVTPGERPIASPLARLQAQEGAMVSSLLYHSVKFEDTLGRKLLTLLDGTRNRQQLLQELIELVDAASTEPAVGSVDERMRETLAGQLDEKLKELGRLGFMIA